MVTLGIVSMLWGGPGVVMDDSLAAALQSTFLLGGEVTDTHRPHPHYSLYKSKGEGYATQEARRKKFLEDQQKRRRDFADHARRIAQGDELSDLSDDGEMEEGGGVDEVDADKSKTEVPHLEGLELTGVVDPLP